MRKSHNLADSNGDCFLLIATTTMPPAHPPRRAFGLRRRGTIASFVVATAIALVVDADVTQSVTHSVIRGSFVGCGGGGGGGGGTG